MKSFKTVSLIVLVVLLSFLLSILFGWLYSYLLPSVGGGLFLMSSNAANQILGIPLAYIFFLTLLFTAFGDTKKYRWIGVLLIPAALFEIYFDLAHIYFPIALGLLGWIIGKGIEMIVAKRKGDVK